MSVSNTVARGITSGLGAIAATAVLGPVGLPAYLITGAAGGIFGAGLYDGVFSESSGGH